MDVNGLKKNINSVSDMVDESIRQSIERDCNNPNFKDSVIEIEDTDILLNVLPLYVKYEKFELANILKNEIINRGVNPNSISKHMKKYLELKTKYNIYE